MSKKMIIVVMLASLAEANKKNDKIHCGLGIFINGSGWNRKNTGFHN